MKTCTTQAVVKGRTCRLLFWLSLAVAMVWPAPAVASGVEGAMALYKKHNYESASRLRDQLNSLPTGQRGQAYLSLGIIYIENARLYSSLHEASLRAHLDYLKKLAAAKGSNRSRAVNLYMAEALLATGKSKSAEKYLDRLIRDPKTGTRAKAVARAGLGLSYYRQGLKQKADAAWSGLGKSRDAEVLTELAWAYSRAGLGGRKPEALCDRALALLSKSGKRPSIRVVNNAAGVYAGAGSVDKALDLLKGSELSAYSEEETLGRNKSIRFYNPTLLKNLSALYWRASVKYLGMAVTLGDPGTALMAQYQLGRAYSGLGMPVRSARAADAFASSMGKKPKVLEGAVEVLRAENLYSKGQKKKGEALLGRLSKDFGGQPYLMAEVVLTCARVGSGCSGIIQRAAAAAETGEGAQFRRLNHALGRHYLMRKDFGKAIKYLEAGRDKSNKNRIEFNDPLLLADLAEAYYSTKKFSEALEIYFEMSKQFPAVRQVQVAMQGVYSIEQKSAGDVKVL